MDYDPYDIDEWNPNEQPYGLLMGTSTGAWGWTWYKNMEDLKMDLAGPIAIGYGLNLGQIGSIKKHLSAVKDYTDFKNVKRQIADIFFEGEKFCGRSILVTTWEDLTAGNDDLSMEELNSFYQSRGLGPGGKLNKSLINDFLYYFREYRSFSS
jgi:hypothetical protein